MIDSTLSTLCCVGFCFFGDISVHSVTVVAMWTGSSMGGAFYRASFSCSLYPGLAAGTVISI